VRCPKCTTGVMKKKITSLGEVTACDGCEYEILPSPARTIRHKKIVLLFSSPKEEKKETQPSLF